MEHGKDDDARAPEPVTRPGSNRWVKGMPSPNPKGRKPGNSLAEAVRRHVDFNALARHIYQLAMNRDETGQPLFVKPETQVAAATWISKTQPAPIQELKITQGASEDSPLSFEELAEVERLLAEERERRELESSELTEH